MYTFYVQYCTGEGEPLLQSLYTRMEATSYAVAMKCTLSLTGHENDAHGSINTATAL